MLSVEIQSFSYDKAVVLRDISFSLDRGKHLAVLGESGCGKSTLLHIVYGLLHLEEGSLFWGDKQLKGPKFNLVPGEPFMKLVAQEYNVMPYISVRENVATYLSRVDPEKDNARVDTLLEVVDLVDFSEVKVKDLSGGQKQRVALAKALANEPEALLLDEPFSHIDTFRKSRLRRQLFTYLKEREITCITATHDSEEALSYSDEIIILNNGSVEVMGSAETVYKQLESEYQAGFFGEVNTLNGRYLLPHQLLISEEKTSWQVTVQRVYFKGSHYLVEAELEGNKVFFNAPERLSMHTKVYLKSE